MEIDVILASSIVFLIMLWMIISKCKDWIYKTDNLASVVELNANSSLTKIPGLPHILMRTDMLFYYINYWHFTVMYEISFSSGQSY